MKLDSKSETTLQTKLTLLDVTMLVRKKTNILQVKSSYSLKNYQYYV